MNWYQKKLTDPRWQKRRLEVLNAADFACSNCGDDKTSLHVHHAIYFKGLDPWEYADEHLVCLCAPCHSEQTEASKKLKVLLAANPYLVPSIVGLVEGFLAASMDVQYVRPSDPDHGLGFAAGMLAGFAFGSVNQCQEMIRKEDNGRIVINPHVRLFMDSGI